MKPEYAFKRAVRAAHEGLESTKTMEGAAGRSAYIPSDRMQGTADPGATAVMAVIDLVHAYSAEHSTPGSSDTWLWPRGLTHTSLEAREKARFEARLAQAAEKAQSQPSVGLGDLQNMLADAANKPRRVITKSQPSSSSSSPAPAAQSAIQSVRKYSSTPYKFSTPSRWGQGKTIVVDPKAVSGPPGADVDYSSPNLKEQHFALDKVAPASVTDEQHGKYFALLERSSSK
jgi:hypothetical protein